MRREKRHLAAARGESADFWRNTEDAHVARDKGARMCRASGLGLFAALR